MLTRRFKQLPLSWFYYVALFALKVNDAIDVPACLDIVCQHDSECADGNADLSQFEEINADFLDKVNLDGKHCICPPGWTGVDCGTKYDTCDRDHVCFHGGLCVLGKIDDFGNDQLYCDCHSAQDLNGNTYSGKFCEKKKEGEYCDADEKYQCTIHGDCNPFYPEKGDPCMCKDVGYTGPHCEYVIDSVPDCTKTCLHGGVCKLGNKPINKNTYMYWINEERPDKFGELEDMESQPDYQWCDCPSGWDGQSCEIPAIPCGGENQCFNDAECVTREVDGETIHHCDCKTDGDTAYAGRFCQYEASAFCTKKKTVDGIIFCVNGGQCNMDDPYKGCDCPDDYKGFSCQYFVGEEPVMNIANNSTGETKGKAIVDPEPTCDLDCGEHGTCNTGIKDTSELGAAQQVEYLVEQNMNLKLEYCVCKTGYTGLQCQYTIEDCPADDHFCLHGGTCGFDPSTGMDKCDCSTSTNPQLGSFFTGIHCEHSISDFCLVDNLTQVEPTHYCANKGHCKKKVKLEDKHPGCKCVGPWEGEFCETHVAQCEDDHYCLHGGTCSVNAATGKQMCDCSRAVNPQNGSFYVGVHCEHSISQVCIEDGPTLVEPTHYCANKGRCKKMVKSNDPHPGCHCSGPWEGEFCETHVSPTTSAAAKEVEREVDNLMLGLLVTFFVIIVVAGCVVTCLYVRKRRKQGKDEDVSNSLRWVAAPGSYAGSTVTKSPAAAEQVNLAPMSSAAYTDAPPAYEGRNAANGNGPASPKSPQVLISSSRDPFATHLAPKQVQPPEEKLDIFVGPPLDEDGNVLHDVL